MKIDIAYDDNFFLKGFTISNISEKSLKNSETVNLFLLFGGGRYMARSVILLPLDVGFALKASLDVMLLYVLHDVP